MGNRNTFKERLKSDITSMNWWYGTLGAVLSTVVGIALTFGVTALVTHYQDKQKARDMMFTVVLGTKESKDITAMVDSLYQVEISDFERIFAYYKQYDGDLDKAPGDSLLLYFNEGMQTIFWDINWPKTGSYFYGAETMHQFDNPEMYSRFATFIEHDEKVLEKISALRKQGQELFASIRAKQACDQKTGTQALKEIIEDHSLFYYYNNLQLASLETSIAKYDEYYHRMLNEMGATEEELEEYAKATDGEKFKEMGN